ncbi:hypothetical protein PHSY_003614 [Pseudozyma hubeiensis SY62]|uniref:Uncharacterized protein n=1 Tax=Pseudozyma hubeiensis (strain SY62) TaxID=1305764 RepID=R9PD65_PSEHS|nr:hypothetical protein PHSY_003614 [Pseudozyma hubeiensis SY62]GAC96035.1 hypothetical protein PHSY_003614 [Pseudozyma hubeiensis SY62]
MQRKQSQVLLDDWSIPLLMQYSRPVPVLSEESPAPFPSMAFVQGKFRSQHACGRGSGSARQVICVPLAVLRLCLRMLTARVTLPDTYRMADETVMASVVAKTCVVRFEIPGHTRKTHPPHTA